MLRVGERVLDFSLYDANGQPVRLRDLHQPGRQLVLYFYPRDESLGCTREACAFRDHYSSFLERSAVVVGISRDSVDSHRAFATRHRLPFILLSDPSGEVHRLYGVGRTLGLFHDRVTFVIDPQPTIRHVFRSPWRPRQHVAEAIRFLDNTQVGSATD